MPPIVREDGREADLPEVDPEEDSQKFMGILIKVSTHSHTHTGDRLQLAYMEKYIWLKKASNTKKNPFSKIQVIDFIIFGYICLYCLQVYDDAIPMGLVSASMNRAV